MRQYRTFAAAALCAIATLALAQDALRIVVIQGEDAVNVIQRKTAVAPIVEIRDRNNLPVAGATVTFTIAGNSATFPGGAQTFTITTNSAGRAAAASITPVSSGAVQIQVAAAAQGQSAAVTISQTNALTAAGGGLSTGATIGIVVAAGAAIGGGAIALSGGRDDPASTGGTNTSSGNAQSTPSTPSSTQPSSTTPTTPTPAPTPAPPANRAPVISTATASRSTVLLGTDTTISFAVSASDADGDALTYSWDFGDGSSASGATATHVYQREGTFVARVTARDRDTSVSGDTQVTVKTLTGNWSNLSSTLYRVVQSGVTLSGTIRSELGFSDGTTLQYECPITGSVQSASPQVRIANVPCAVARGTVLPSVRLLDPDERIDRLTGTAEVNGQVLIGSYLYVRQ